MDNSTKIQYGHARNCHPAPSITISVEGGQIVRIKFDDEAIRKYSQNEMCDLFEAVGVKRGRILIPIPDRFMNKPMSSLRFGLVPGEYEVRQLGEHLQLPESAFRYSIA